MTITLTRLKESLPVHAPYIKEGFRTCSLTDLLAILTWNISPRGKIAPRPTTAEVPQQGGQQAMHVISRAADHYLVGLTAKDCPATPRHNACDTQHLRMEVVTRSPPDKLRALVEGLRTELEEDVKNVLARNIQTIEKPKGTWDGVLKEFFEDYKRNVCLFHLYPSFTGVEINQPDSMRASLSSPADPTAGRPCSCFRLGTSTSERNPPWWWSSLCSPSTPYGPRSREVAMRYKLPISPPLLTGVRLARSIGYREPHNCDRVVQDGWPVSG